MKRDPSIHVRRSDLHAALLKVGLKLPAGKFDSLLRALEPRQIRNRSIVQAPKAAAQRKAKVAAAEVPLTTKEIVNIIHTERVAAGHRMMAPIHEGDSSWTLATMVARDAYEFAKAYEYSPLSVGYRAYVAAGIKLMGRTYALNKFRYMQERIYTAVGTEILVDRDPNPEATREMAAHYIAMAGDHSDAVVKLTKRDMADMIHARTDARICGADYEGWIAAQFDGLAFCGAVPRPTQLHGDTAMRRYRDYRLNTPKIQRDSFGVGATTGDDAMDDYYALLMKKTKHSED